MLIFLLIFEVLITFIIVLSHRMLQKKYTEIEKSTHIYMDKRAYRTQQRIVFIDNIIKRYLDYINQEKELPDVYSMIKSNLLREYIGKFPFIAVNNVAHKSKHIMWGMIVLEMVIAYINDVATSLEGIVVIVSSILLAIGVEIFIIINALEEKKETTIVSIEDYILNAYPLQANKVAKSNNIKEKKILEEEQLNEPMLLNQDKTKDSSSITIDKPKIDKKERNSSKDVAHFKEGLTEKDIIKFIKHLNKV